MRKRTESGCKVDKRDGSVDGDRSSTGGSSSSKSIVDGVSDDSVEYELDEMDTVREIDTSETEIELNSVEKSSIVGV